MDESWIQVVLNSGKSSESYRWSVRHGTWEAGGFDIESASSSPDLTDDTGRGHASASLPSDLIGPGPLSITLLGRSSDVSSYAGANLIESK